VPRRPQHETPAEPGRRAGAVASAIARHPREFVGIVMASAAVTIIFVNALYLQKGPHPAPIFATRPVIEVAPSQPQSGAVPAVRTPVHLTADIQRELSRRGYYDGVADGIWGAKTDAGVRDFMQAAGLKMNSEPTEALLRAIMASAVRAPSGNAAGPVANDPIARLIAPTKKVLAIQRALSDFGYGQIKPTGVYDPETRTAIEKFERDHRLPPTGQISDRFVRELSAMTGRPLE
jgi:peptidoglycan hydrolase-like protein with peptidoglycan-binding domain